MSPAVPDRPAMLLDILIILLAGVAVYRGRQNGFLRQFWAIAGFFIGLLIGRWLEPHAVGLVHTVDARAIIAVVVVFGSALLGLSIGEYIGLHFKHRLLQKRLNKLDNLLGS